MTATLPPAFEGKYPRGLYLLFFTEMWERFTFYGNRALLILFMVNQLGFDDAKGNMVYGVYQSLIYAMPVIGGMLADKLLGQQRSIIWGGILLAIGSLVMAIPVNESFFAGMGILIVGNGFFKPNISTVVGSLYAPEDPRRDSGFSFFYMGINIGGMLGGLLCGWIGQQYSWHLGFGLAGIFMVLGLLVFLYQRKVLGDIGHEPDPILLKQPLKLGLTRERLVYIGSVLVIPAFIWLLYHHEIYNYIINPFGVIALLYVIWVAYKQGPHVMARIGVALVLIIFSSLFWAFYEQGGGSLNLFAERNVRMEAFGFQLSSAAVNNSINSLLIILLTPLFMFIWLWLSASKREPSAAMKFALGLVQLGIGFYVLVWGSNQASDGFVSLWVFVLGYVFMSTGELCLSPIGLSAITKLAPVKMVGLMMGLWFLASSYGQYLAGLIGSWMAIPEDAVSGKLMPPAQSIVLYSSVFEMIAWVSIGCGVLLALLAPVLNRAMVVERSEVGMRD